MRNNIITLLMLYRNFHFIVYGSKFHFKLSVIDPRLGSILQLASVFQVCGVYQLFVTGRANKDHCENFQVSKTYIKRFEVRRFSH